VNKWIKKENGREITGVITNNSCGTTDEP